MLKSIEHTRVSQEAVSQIIALIKGHQLNPGDRLPGERQLVTALSISRSSVREALRSLEGMGLIEVRPGLGTFVKHPISKFMANSLPHPLLLDRTKLKNLFQLRQIIETGAAAVAAREATSTDLANIREAVKQMEAYFEDDDLDGMVEADIALHRAILIATGNDILVLVMDNIVDLMREMRRTSLSISEGGRQSVASHRAILDALERGDPLSARQAMQEHLQTVASKLDAVKFTSQDEFV